MGDFDDEFTKTLTIQSWSLYSVGMLFIILRMIARTTRLGIAGLQADDYLMCVVGFLYTALVVCLNVITANGGSNLYPPEMEGTFTPLEIQERIYGSKIVIVSEQAMLNVIYCIKACLLIMYGRLTLGLKTQKMVRYLEIYVAVGWVATEVAFFTACRPFSGYWGMPPPDPQCTTLEHYAEVQGVFNITSDLLMICIPLPLMIKMNVPWKQKLVLVIIFSMGLFVVTAALLTKIFNLTDVYDPSYMLWYVREASVAVYVSNLPVIWPMIREYLPFLRSLVPGASSRTRSRTRTRYGGKSGTPANGAHSAHNTFGASGVRGGASGAGGAVNSTQRSKFNDLVSGRSRRHRGDSLGSLEDGSYDDLEMTLKSLESGGAATSGNGAMTTHISVSTRPVKRPYEIKPSGVDGSSTEHIVEVCEPPSTASDKVAIVPPENAARRAEAYGGIQVRRTVEQHSEPVHDVVLTKW